VKGWNDKKGVVGVYVHNLQDRDQEQSAKGSNPFASIKYGDSGEMLSDIVKAYDPPYSSSTDTYECIKENLATWVEDAITVRNNN
jgi:hypothetical protein